MLFLHDNTMQYGLFFPWQHLSKIQLNKVLATKAPQSCLKLLHSLPFHHMQRAWHVGSNALLRPLCHKENMLFPYRGIKMF
mmetsp:Transcript_26152/g.43252  ORF Transcript_26152/g.43252 Transcript_26152/m.43252 type:complete len:81 (+) Transcript_26152:133-375(+)